MGAADVFGMFDKLDDIVYRPVDAGSVNLL